VRDRKHLSGRKRAKRSPLADSECAAAHCKKLSEKANAFFDKLKDHPVFSGWSFYVR